MEYVPSFPKTQRTYRKTWGRYSLRTLMLFAMLCVFTIGIATVGVDVLVLLLVIESVVIVSSVELLMRNLPRAILASIDDNSVRMDGTYSQRRAIIEKMAQRKLRWDLLFSFGFIVAPSNILLYGIHAYVIPLPVATDAVAAIRYSTTERTMEIRDRGVSSRFAKWQANNGVSNPVEARSRKQLVRDSWTILAGLGAIWIALSLQVLKSTYFSALRELAVGIRWRSKQYDSCDIGRLRS
jgi:hypothetical protein